MSMELAPAPLPAISQPTQYFCLRHSSDTELSRRLILGSVEALLILLACCLIFLGVFGAFRRCCINRTLVLFGFGAYTILFTTIAYTLGLIQDATFCNELFPLGALFLVVAPGSADSYMVHRLEDVERWRSLQIEWVTKCYMVLWMVQRDGLAFPGILFGLVVAKLDCRIRALMLASRDVMQKNCVFLADYMKTEHRCNDQVDPSSLRGYKYYVSEAEETKVHLLLLRAFWRERDPLIERATPEYEESFDMTDDVITVEKVWNCKGRLLRARGGDPDGQLKDLCLSFSFFNLIRLRFAGYSLPREAHDKLRSLICLLAEENSYERVFRVIEVELALLFDLFYTNFSVVPSVYLIVVEILLLGHFLAFFLRITSFYGKHQHESMWFTHEAFVALLMMITILGIEFVQFGFRVFSEWAKVRYICVYVRNKWCQENRIIEKLIEIMCKVKLRKPWGRQLRQYSLLKKCSYSPSKLINNTTTAVYFDIKSNGQQEIAPTRMSKDVMKAIAHFLRNNGTRNLENGRDSLMRNKVFDQLSWACDLESTTRVIMVWHIATSICEHEQRQKRPFPVVPQGQRENFNRAMMLSRYLAYLVAYAPRLLPEHPCRTQHIFDCVVKEARELFMRRYRTDDPIGRVVRKARELFRGRWISMDERIKKLKALDDETYGGTIVGQGARLGRQLLIETTDEEHIWTVLADFWVEMMLYVAPSNDLQAHAKYLATGGEFVTHLWALLSHAGIVRSPHGGGEHHDHPEGY